jgi:branched-chain amino acid transport system substrate-binding protein
MHFVRFVALAAAFAVGTALLALPAAATPAPRELVIGSLAPETGPLAPVLESMRTPVDLAIAEINAAGGVGGLPVREATADEGAEPETTARDGFDKLVASGAQVIVGPATPGAALALQERIGTRRVLTCSGSDTSSPLEPDITKGHYFRTAPPDTIQALALAELVLADGHNRPAVLFREDTYGDGIATPLVRALEAGGAKVTDEAYDPDAATHTREIERAVTAKTDAIVLVGFADDGATIVKELAADGTGPAQVATYGVETMQSPQFRDAVADPALIAGMKGTMPAGNPAGISHSFAASLAATGVDPVFSAHIYDCTMLSALAAVAAKSTDPTKLSKAFAANLDGKNDCNTFAACKALLENGKTIHYRGASSNFDHFGSYEPEEGAFDQWSWDATGNVVVGDASTQILISG